MASISHLDYHLKETSVNSIVSLKTNGFIYISPKPPSMMEYLVHEATCRGAKQQQSRALRSYVTSLNFKQSPIARCFETLVGRLIQLAEIVSTQLVHHANSIASSHLSRATNCSRRRARSKWSQLSQVDYYKTNQKLCTESSFYPVSPQ